MAERKTGTFILAAGASIAATLAAIATNIVTADLPKIVGDHKVLATGVLIAAGAAAALLAGFLARAGHSPIPAISALGKRSRSNAVDQLCKFARIDWVEHRLDFNVPSDERIPLRFAYRPSQVELPWAHMAAAAEKRGDSQAASNIGEVFERAGEELLILGDAGAGKSTLTLELVKHLLSVRTKKSQRRAPVVLHLPSWTSKSSLAEWIASELQVRYRVRPSIAAGLLDGDRIVLVLDGLDQVAADEFVGCINAINMFRETFGHLSIAVCCRSVEYFATDTKLKLRSAIEVLPVPPETATDYLCNLLPQSGAADLLANTDLMRVLTTPLMIRLLIPAIGSPTFFKRIREATSDEECKDVLLESHVMDLLFPTDPTRVRPIAHVWKPGRDILQWFAWLARGMQADKRTIVSTGLLEPAWLPGRRQKSIEVWTVAGIGRGLGCLIAGIIGAFYWDIWFGLLLTVGLFTLFPALAGTLQGLVIRIVGRRYGWTRDTAPTISLPTREDAIPRSGDEIHYSGFRRLYRPSLWVLGAGTDIILAASLASLAGSRLLAAALVVTGSLFPALFLLRVSQGAILLGVAVFYFAFALSTATFGAFSDAVIGLALGLSIAICGVIVVAFMHVFVRVLTARRGLGPLRYRRLFEYGSDLGLMYRVGAGYMFQHDLVVKYLAKQVYDPADAERADFANLPQGERLFDLLRITQQALGRPIPQIFDAGIRSAAAQTWLSRGRAKYTNGETKEAIRLFTLAVGYDDSLGSAYFARMEAYVQLGCYEEALRDTDKLIELRPNSSLGNLRSAIVAMLSDSKEGTPN